MFSNLNAIIAKFGAVILVSLFLLQAAFAQGVIDKPGNRPPLLAPGLWTSVNNGQIVVQNSGASGRQPGAIQPPMAIPRVVGPNLQVPPTLGDQWRIDKYRGRILTVIDEERALTAAVMACSNSTQAACESEMRDLMALISVLYSWPNNVSYFLVGAYRAVVAGIQASGGDASIRAVNLAALDNMFGSLSPDDTWPRSASVN